MQSTPAGNVAEEQRFIVGQPWKPDQHPADAAVADANPLGIAGETREFPLRAVEWRLGVDDRTFERAAALPRMAAGQERCAVRLENLFPPLVRVRVLASSSSKRHRNRRSRTLTGAKSLALPAVQTFHHVSRNGTVTACLPPVGRAAVALTLPRQPSGDRAPAVGRYSSGRSGHCG